MTQVITFETHTVMIECLNYLMTLYHEDELEFIVKANRLTIEISDRMYKDLIRGGYVE